MYIVGNIRAQLAYVPGDLLPMTEALGSFAVDVLECPRCKGRMNLVALARVAACS